MSDIKHAILGASSAHRWLNCPGSALLTADLPDTTSPYAEEGTQAHAVCEQVARMELAKEFQLVSYAGPVQPPEDNQEMLECAAVYLNAIQEAIAGLQLSAGDPPYIALEQRVDFSQWVPDGFGTADCILIGNGILHVIDYKHGKGVQVEAEGNPQLMLYALGALMRYQPLYFIHTVRWSIVQPRNGGVSQAPDMTADVLLKWAEETVKPAAILADTPDAPLNPGDWCRFCKARATCRARSDYNLALEGFTKTEPALLSAEEIGAILIRSRDLARWISDLEEHALTALLDGQEIPGWKAVAGRALRIWTDQEAAFAKAMELGTPEAMLYERRPVSLAQLEKLMGKKAFQPLTDFVTVPPGKPTLAPQDDKRAAITNRSAAEDDFKNS